MHHRLLRGDGGFGDAFGLRALVVGLLGDGLVVQELLAAGEIGLGEGEIGARLRQVGAHLIEHDLERPVIDGEEKIALLHHLTVGEVDVRQIARHPRADLDRVDGDEASDIFVLVDDGALDRTRDGDARRRRRARLPLALAAAGKKRQSGRDGGGRDKPHRGGGGRNSPQRRSPKTVLQNRVESVRTIDGRRCQCWRPLRGRRRGFRGCK